MRSSTLLAFAFSLACLPTLASAATAPYGEDPVTACNNGGTVPPPCDCLICPCNDPTAPSIMNPFSGLYIHDAVIYQTAGRSSAGGCVPCGASAGLSDLPANLPSLALKRFYRSRNGGFAGSLGDNHYLSTDVQIRLDWWTDGVTVRVFDPSQPTYKRYFQEQSGSDTANDGVLHDNTGVSRDARMYDVNGVLTANGADVATVVITDTDGTAWTFEVYDSDYGSYARGGRLLSITERTGVVRQAITYAFPLTATYAQLGYDRARLWQIAQVTAADGTAATYTYDNSMQRGGRYAVSRIDLPNGTSTTFAYAGNDLTAETLPDGTSATFAVSYDTTLQKVKTVISDPAAEPDHQFKTVWWSGSSYQQADSTVIAQTYGQIRRVDNGAGEPILVTWSGPYANDWTYASPTYLWHADSGLVYYTVSPAAVLPTSRSYAENFVLGQDPHTTALTDLEIFKPDTNHEVITVHADALGRPRSSTYDYDLRKVTSFTEYDGSTSYTTYNSFGFPLTETDRVGRVTTYTYDAQGNRLSKTTGTGSESSTWSWEYDGLGLMTASIDANGNRTDYTYDAAGRLLTVVEPADSVGGVRPYRSFTYDAAGQLTSQTDASGRTVLYAHDARGRVVTATYADSSTEITAYGTGAQSGLVVAVTDRNAHSTVYGYDAAGRRVHTEIASGTPAVQYEDCSYVPGSAQHKLTCVRGGETTTYGYDARGRQTSMVVSPTLSVALTSNRVYDPQKRAYGDEDPYGRWVYRTFDPVGRVTRTVRELVPGAIGGPAVLTAQANALYASLPFVGADIGGPSLAGSSVSAGGTVTIQGSGADVWGTSDQFHFYARPISSDVALTVRLDSQTQPDYWSKSGIMLRSSAAPDAAYVFLMASTGGVAVQYRTAVGGGADWPYVFALPGQAAPVWLRAVLTDASVTLTASADGTTWTTVGTLPFLRVPGALVGLAVTSHTNGALSTAAFSNLSLLVGTVDPAQEEPYRDAYLASLLPAAAVNPAYIIESQSYNAEGQLLAQVNGRGISATKSYDSQGRVATSTDAAGTADAALVTYGYDAQGNRTTITDPRGAVTTQVFTKRNLVKSVTEATGTADAATTIYTYTPTRNVATITDPRGYVTFNAYGTCCDRLVSVTDPLGFSTTYTYDAVGNRTSVTDANNLTTVTAYDARNRPIGITDAAGQTTSIAYTENAAVLPGAAGLGLGVGADGSAITTTNALGEQSIEIHDGIGRTVRQIDGLGHRTTWGYDSLVADSGVTLVASTVTDALNHTTTSLVDGAGLPRVSIDALAKRSTAGFDAAGNRVTSRDPNGVGKDCAFDARNRDVLCQDTTGAATARHYDANGNLVQTVDATGQSSFATFDLRNRKITATDRISAVTTFAYDPASNLVQITDAQGGLTDYVYDVRNLLATEVFPAGQQGRTRRVYAYDAGRRLTTRTTQAVNGSGVGVGPSEATTYSYDAANRLVTRGYADGKNDTYAYDQASRLTTATSGRYANRVRRTYDAASRITAEILAYTSGPAINIDLPVGYGYDDDNRLTTLTYPDGSVVHRDYTVRNELFHIWDGAQVVGARTYDNGGRLVQTLLGNGLTESRTYLANDNLVQTIVVPGVTSFTYGYDAVKRKTSELNGIDANQGQTFAYDAQSRLVGWKRAAGTAPTDPVLSTQTWQLSAVGDWNQSVTDGVTQTRTHSPVHEALTLTTGATTVPLSYDFKGNLVQDDQGQAFAWDPENRLRSAGNLQQGQGLSATYAYDALGRRIQKSVTLALAAGSTPAEIVTTTFVSAGAQEVVEITGDLTAFNDPAADPEDAGVNPYDPVTGTGARGSLLDDAAAQRFNAQPPSTDTPDGWTADLGATQATSASRGWSSAVAGVDRDHLGRPLYDSFLPVDAATWTIPVANGTHAVVLMCGDADSRAQTNNLLVNGVSVTDPTPYDGNVTNGYETGSFDGYALTVTVTNGLLTISAGSGSLNPKVNFIEIGATGSAIDQTTTDRVAAAADKATKDTAKTKAKRPPLIKRNIWGAYVDSLISHSIQLPRKSVMRYFAHANHVYSVSAVSNATGQVVSRYAYASYGKQTMRDVSGAPTAHDSARLERGFTGYQLDGESGLCYARARFYAPGLGRFINRDLVNVFEINKETSVRDRQAAPVSVFFAKQKFEIAFVRKTQKDRAAERGDLLNSLGYGDGYSLYAAYFVPNQMDPSGKCACTYQFDAFSGGIGGSSGAFNGMDTICLPCTGTECPFVSQTFDVVVLSVPPAPYVARFNVGLTLVGKNPCPSCPSDSAAGSYDLNHGYGHHGLFGWEHHQSIADVNP